MIKLVICGNYGATNIGDEAILDGILTLIRRVEPSADVTVLSSNPADTRVMHGVKSANLLPCGLRSFARGILKGEMMKTFKVIKECDGFILGGGGLLSDEKPMAMIIWPLQAAFASLFKKPFFCLGQSVGPLNTFFGKRITRSIYKKALLSSVRDSSSQKVLHQLGLYLSPVLADPAFAVHLSNPVETQREKIVLFSLRSWPAGDTKKSYKLLAHYIDWLWLTFGFKSVLVPFSAYPENDSIVLNNILVQVAHKEAAQVYEYSGNYRNVMELMSRSKAVIGMRLHSLIFATLTKTPFLALSYSNKVRGLALDLGMRDYIYDWANLNIEDLKTGFKQLMEDYEKVYMNLGEQNLLMRAGSHKHEEMLQTFIEACKTKATIKK